MRRDRNYPPFWNHPPEFFGQVHGDNSSHDTSHCIVLRKEFAMLYPEFMEYRRRRLLELLLGCLLYTSPSPRDS